MSFDPKQFRAFILAPALTDCEKFAAIPHTPFAEDLLMATCAQESALGHYLHQTGRGPAVSIFQIEPATLHDLQRNFIDPSKKTDGSGAPRFNELLRACSALAHPLEEEIIWNLRLATICARLFYLRVERNHTLPTEVSFDNLWHWYKTYYNTAMGAATEASFLQAINRYTDLDVA